MKIFFVVVLHVLVSLVDVLLQLLQCLGLMSVPVYGVHLDVPSTTTTVGSDHSLISLIFVWSSRCQLRLRWRCYHVDFEWGGSLGPWTVDIPFKSLREFHLVDKEVFFCVSFTFLNSKAHQFKVLLDCVDCLSVVTVSVVNLSQVCAVDLPCELFARCDSCSSCVAAQLVQLQWGSLAFNGECWSLKRSTIDKGLVPRLESLLLREDKRGSRPRQERPQLVQLFGHGARQISPLKEVLLGLSHSNFGAEMPICCRFE